MKEPKRRPIYVEKCFVLEWEERTLDGRTAVALLLGMFTTEMSALNPEETCKGASYRTVYDAQTLPIRQETGQPVKVRRRGCCTSVMLSDSPTY